MQRGRQALKDKLEGKDKKKFVVTALAPLAALLLMEETAFAATYVPAAMPNMANTNTQNQAAQTTAKTSKAYLIASCVIAICAISVAAYFAALPTTTQEYVEYEPTHDYVQAPEPEVLEPKEDEPYETIDYEPAPTEPEESEEQEPDEPSATYEPLQEDDHEQIAVEPVQEPYQPREPDVTAQTEETHEEYEPEETEEEAEEELEEEPEDEPEPAYEPEPIHIDRTPQILAALSAANSPSDVNGIISRYDFVFATQTRRHSTGEQFRFYVTNEGSGDIMIGTVAYEDGTGWRMRFRHFVNGSMPTDIFDLLNFMAG